MTKHRATTDLILELETDVSCYGGGASKVQYQLRVDDATDGPANGGALFVPTPVSAGSNEYHGWVSIKAVFKNLPAGVRSVSLWSRAENATILYENQYSFDRTVYAEESPSR